MTSIVYTKTYHAPQVDKTEALRYAGVRGEEGSAVTLLDSCVEEAEGALVYRVCYRKFPVLHTERGYEVELCEFSPGLSARLSACTEVIVFCATVGVGIDRLIGRYSSVDRARALMMDAYGTERVESLCDAFCLDVEEEARAVGRNTRPRFSPGYTDIPLQMQKNIFAALDCPRQIGVCLNESLLMSPSKSVSGLVGICD